MLGRHQNQEICGTLIPPLVIFFSFSYHWIQIFQMRKMQCFSLARNFNNMIRSILATRTRTRRHLLQLGKFKFYIFLSSVALVALIFVSRISLHFRFNRQKKHKFSRLSDPTIFEIFPYSTRFFYKNVNFAPSSRLS